MGHPPYPGAQPPPGQTAYQQPPPSYSQTAPGQPAPGYGAQPYGGQPYPPPGYAPGPGPYYGAPSMYPPTYHPGLYDKPQQTPFLDFGNLFKLLFRPQEAFEDLYDHTSATQGFTLAIIFIALSSALGLIANLVFLGQWDLPEDAGVTGFTSSSAASSVIGIFTGIIFFWITAWMFHALVKDKGRNASLDKTIGMMGYAKFPAFIVMVLIAVLTPLTLIGSLADLEDNPDQAIGAVCGTLALIFGLGIIGICWSFWVHSHAQSVANDLSTSTAFGYLLLTWFLVFLIEAAVTFVLLFVIVGTAFGV